MKTQYSSFDSLEGLTVRSSIACPVSGERLDERAVRLVATLTWLLVLAYGIWGWFWVPAFLLVDFSMRGVISRRWAPMAMLARGTVKLLQSPGKKINAGPKIFAARLGIGFAAALVLLQAFGLSSHLSTHIVVGMFAGAAFLESAFAVCVGCHIYTLLQTIKARSKPVFLGEGI